MSGAANQISHRFDDDQPYPTICGHILNEKEMKAFLLFLDGVPVKDIAKSITRSTQTVSKWIHTDWWKQMYRDQLEERQMMFEAALTKQNERILEGYMDVMNSRDKNTAMARIQGAKAYMEMGDNPLIKKQPNTVVNHNTLIQTGKLDPEKISELTDDELLEAARTGVVPDKVKMGSE